jgi:hypothetical protein
VQRVDAAERARLPRVRGDPGRPLEDAAEAGDEGIAVQAFRCGDVEALGRDRLRL